jgi:hypothetical protein
MMKDGVCPMCKSTDVYTSDEILFRAYGQIVKLGVPSGEMELSPYVCANCGFAAMFGDDMDKVAEVRKAKEWKKVKK